MTPMEIARSIKRARDKIPALTDISQGLRDATVDQIITVLAVDLSRSKEINTRAELKEFYETAGMTDHGLKL